MASSKLSRLKEIRITPEGWVFLTILAFIAVGAVLRNVNLLILMAGMLVAPLIINWRLAVLWLKSTSAHRILPFRTHAHQLASVQWVCYNAARFTAWNIEICDNLELEERTAENVQHASGFFRLPRWSDYRSQSTPPLENSAKPGSKFNAKIAITQIGAQRSEVATYRVYFTRRGCYRAGPAMLSTRFPFGLVTSQIHLPAQEVFYVAPAIGKLSPVWDRRVRSAVTGSDAIQRKRGLEEDEFYALRPWRSGDSRRQIHWRSSAKIGQPIIKQHEQPDNRDFAMLLDLFSVVNAADGPAEFDCPKCEQVLSFAATVLQHLPTAVQGKIGVAVCGLTTALCRSRNHRALFEQAMQELAIATPSTNPSLTQPLLDLAGSVSTSTPIYIISTRVQADEFAFLQTPNSDSTSTPQQTQDVIRQLKSVWPAVRWLSVDSADFQSLFSAVPSVDAVNLQALANKWIPENATC